MIGTHGDRHKTDCECAECFWANLQNTIATRDLDGETIIKARQQNPRGSGQPTVKKESL